MSNEMSYRLSICIPTFNRAEFLNLTLSNIIPLINADIEIVIMDGASTDDTSKIVQKWKNLCPSINYVQGDINNGVDADLASCVEFARGEYCWLMSSDDLFLETSIKRVMQEINEKNYTVLLGCRVDCSKEMKPLGNQHWIKHTDHATTFNFFNSDDFILYFDQVDSLGALFSYISSIIIHRQSWMNVKNGNKFFGTNYAHVFRIFEMLKKNGSMRYIDEPLVLCRMDNDSFSSEGLVKRFKIDYVGYSKIANGLFESNPKILNSMLKVLTREHKWPRLLKIRAHCQNPTEWKKIKDEMKIFGYSEFTLYSVEIIGKLKPIVFTIVWIYEVLKKTRSFFSNIKLNQGA